MEVSGLGGFLGDPNQGGGPEDLEAVGDWAAFAKRHRDTFCYDDRRSPALISLRCKPKQNSKNKKMVCQSSDRFFLDQLRQILVSPATCFFSSTPKNFFCDFFLR